MFFSSSLSSPGFHFFSLMSTEPHVIQTIGRNAGERWGAAILRKGSSKKLPTQQVSVCIAVNEENIGPEINNNSLDGITRFLIASFCF